MLGALLASEGSAEPLLLLIFSVGAVLGIGWAIWTDMSDDN